MADVATTFSTLSNDAPNVFIARETLKIAERNLVLGKFADRYSLPQRMGKTLRVIKHSRMALPRTTLTEGVPPDAVALSISNVDVTVEQWGIVALITDVAQVSITHAPLQVAIERTGMAMSELLEREIGETLMAGTSVLFPNAVTARNSLATTTDKFTTAMVLKGIQLLRAKGAPNFEGALYGGVVHPAQEADLLGGDSTFQQASNFANVKRLENAEIGTWMGARWYRGNFMPGWIGHAAPDTSAAAAFKPQINAVDGGGAITSSTNHKFKVVYKEAETLIERRITQNSANIASAATGNNESFTVTVAAGDIVNYVYDVYMTTTAAAGAGSLYKVLSNQATTVSAAITVGPAGTEDVAPEAPASTVNVFVGWLFGRSAFGRVELNGMSLESYLTEPGATWANPLAQGRKCGNKIMWKCFLLDNSFMVRLETSASAGYTWQIPA